MSSPSLKTFLGQSLVLWLAQMGGIVVSVAAGIFITRALGPEGRGIYTWLLTLAAVGANMGLFGLDISNRRFAAAHPQQVAALLHLNLWMIFGMGSALTLALGVLAFHQPAAGGSLLNIGVAVGNVPLTAFAMAMGSVLVAQGGITKAALLNFLPKLVLAISCGTLVVTGLVTETSALMVNLASNGLAAVMVLVWLWPSIRQPGHLKPLPYLKSVWATYSAGYAAGLSYYLMQKADVLLVGIYLGHAPTGYYGVASNMVDIMITPISVIANLLATRLAAGQQKISGPVVGITMGLTVAGCVLTYAIAPWMIPFLYGHDFAPAVPVLQLLCPAVVGLAFFMLMQNALTACGRARYLALPAMLGCVVNIGLNVALIPAYGLPGACWSSIVAYSAAGLTAWALVRGSGGVTNRHKKQQG